MVELYANLYFQTKSSSGSPARLGAPSPARSPRWPPRYRRALAEGADGRVIAGWEAPHFPF